VLLKRAVHRELDFDCLRHFNPWPKNTLLYTSEDEVKIPPNYVRDEKPSGKRRLCDIIARKV